MTHAINFVRCIMGGGAPKHVHTRPWSRTLCMYREAWPPFFVGIWMRCAWIPSHLNNSTLYHPYRTCTFLTIIIIMVFVITGNFLIAVTLKQPFWGLLAFGFCWIWNLRTEFAISYQHLITININEQRIVLFRSVIASLFFSHVVHQVWTPVLCLLTHLRSLPLVRVKSPASCHSYCGLMLLDVFCCEY